MKSPLKRALALVVFLVCPASLAAQTSQLEFGDTTVYINADQMEYKPTEQKVHFSGHVEVRTGPYKIQAESMSLDLETSLLQAHDGVRITATRAGEEKEILSAQEARIELPENRGMLVNGRMVVPSEKGEVTIWGEKLEWLDEHTFRFESGGFTTCRCSPGQKPDWSVEAEKMDADTERAVKLKSARIQIRERTVFYIPIFSYPLGTERRSGFLLPEVSSSSVNGWEAGLPYYQVLGPSADATLYPRYLEKRGFKGGSEFRYNLGEAAEGRAEAHGMQDEKEDADRWAFIWEHRSVLPYGFELKSDINLISDNEYVVDFDDFRGLRYSRALESRLVGAYHRPGSNLTAELSWFDDLMGGDLRWSRYGEDQDDLMIQRLPEVRFTMLPAEIAKPFYIDLSSRAAIYYREEMGAGRGTRVDIIPRLVYADRWDDVLEVWSATGWREIFYHPDPNYFDEDSRTGRPELTSRISAPLERIYLREEAPNRYRHTIEPGIIYLYRGETRNIKDPFFQEFEPTSEINLMGINLESRLFRKPNAPEKNVSINEVNRVEVTQFYDHVNGEFPDLRVELLFDPRFPVQRPGSWGNVKFRLNGYYGWEDEIITRVWAEAQYIDPRRDSFRLGYLEDSGSHKSHLFPFISIPARDLLAGTRIIINRNLQLSYKTHYSLEYERITDQQAALDFTAPQRCWAVTLQAGERIRPDRPASPHDIKTAVFFRLEGI